jgi:hypothetical protein
MAIMTAITKPAIVATRKANPTGTIAPIARLSMCIFQQMLVSEQAVIVQACRQPQSAGRAPGVVAKIRQLTQLR